MHHNEIEEACIDQNILKTNKISVSCQGFCDEDRNYFNYNSVSEIIGKYTFFDNKWHHVSCTGITDYQDSVKKQRCTLCCKIANSGYYRKLANKNIILSELIEMEEDTNYDKNTRNNLLNKNQLIAKIENQQRQLKNGNKRENRLRQKIDKMKNILDKDDMNINELSKEECDGNCKDLEAVLNLSDIDERLSSVINALMKHNNLSNEDSIEYTNNVSDIVASFKEKLQVTIMQLKHKGTGVRYSSATIRLALSIWQRSPAGYEEVRETLKLPSGRQIKRYKPGESSKSGFNSQLFERVIQFKNGIPTDIELITDEKSIKCGLHWNTSTNTLIGFTDYTNDYKDLFESMSPDYVAEPCKYVSQWMYRASYSSEHVALCYYCESTIASAEDLYQQFLDVLLLCESSQLIVRFIMSDAGGGNAALYKKLKGRRSPIKWDEFVLTEDCYSFDHPLRPGELIFLGHCHTHGLKAYRNVLLSERILYFRSENHAISIKAVHDCFIRDNAMIAKSGIGTSGLSIDAIAPDFFNKMNVKFAKQMVAVAVIVSMITYCYDVFDKEHPGKVIRWIKPTELEIKNSPSVYWSSSITDKNKVIGLLLAEVRYVQSFDHLWPSELFNPIHTAEYLAVGNALYTSLFMCKREYITVDNVSATLQFVTGIFTTFFEPWRLKTAEYKALGKPNWDDRFISHQTYLNLRISVYGFLGYCQKMVTLNSKTSVPLFKTINVLHSNSSIIEGYFSVIASQVHGTMDSQSYSSASKITSTILLQKSLKKSLMYSPEEIEDDIENKICTSLPVETREFIASRRKSYLARLNVCITENCEKWLCINEVKITEENCLQNRPSSKHLINSLFSTICSDTDEINISKEQILTCSDSVTSSSNSTSDSTTTSTSTHNDIKNNMYDDIENDTCDISDSDSECETDINMSISDISPVMTTTTKGIKHSNIDIDFLNYLSGKSVIELFTKCKRCQDLYCLDTTRMKLYINTRGYDETLLLSGFSNWLDNSILKYEDFNHLLWLIFNDLIGLFKCTLGKKCMKNSRVSFNKVIENYFSILFKKRFSEIYMKPEYTNFKCNELIMSTVFSIINYMFKEYLLTTYCSSDPITDKKNIESSTELNNNIEIEYLSFFGWAISSIINKEKCKLKRQSSDIMITSSEILSSLLLCRDLEKNIDFERKKNLPVFWSIVNRGGLSIPKYEFFEIGKDILQFIARNTDISKRGSDGIDFVKRSCFEPDNYSKWLDKFKACFNSISDEATTISDTTKNYIFREILLKILHARVNSIVKIYKDLNLSRFYSSKTSTHSTIREVLKQSKRNLLHSSFEKLNPNISNPKEQKFKEQKMQVARWEPRSKVDETSLDAIIAKLIGFRLEALTDEETDLVRAALSPPHNEIVLIEKFNTPITRRLIKCLANGEWLNDEIINFSMCMLQERDTKLCEIYTNRRSSHYFSSFFISKLLDSENKTYNYGNVKRWSKKFNTFDKDMIFCPVNLNNAHWTMLVMFIQQKKIQYFDSFGGPGDMYLKGALRYLGDEAERLGLKEFKKEDWQLVSSQQSTPKQENGFDCGIFSIMFADFVTDSLPLNFQQGNMPLFRTKICANVLRGSLKYQLISPPR